MEISETSLTQSSFDVNWYRKNLQLSDQEPTDAAGELEFCLVKTKKNKLRKPNSVENSSNLNEETKDNNSEIELRSIQMTAQYVRLSSETPVEVLYELLTQQWELTVPDVIISVIGGNDDIRIRTPLRKKFQKTLTKAADNAGAWIVTGGIHNGVTKTVGNAISKYYTSATRKILALGIANWNDVANRKTLINEANGSEPVKYPSSSHNGLNTYHNHFILVDDGNNCSKVGEEIELRSRVEKYIVERNSNAHVISVLVQGVKPHSLMSVHNSLQHGIPVVVMADSGGWANVLTAMCKGRVDSSLLVELMRENRIDVSDQTKRNSLIKIVENCVKMKDLITVFEINQPNGSFDLDKAVLQTVFKTCSHQNHTKNHLRLALAWNRADVALTDVLTAGVTLDDLTISEIFKDALLHNKPEFVQLLLDYYVNLRHSFSTSCLIDLYKITVLKNLRGDSNQFYLNEIRKIQIVVVPLSHGGDDRRELPIKNVDILREFFIWCILSKKKECARVLFKGLRDSLSAAIVACSMLKSISKDDDSKDEKEDCLAHAAEYSDICYGILSECLSKNSYNTLLFLKRRMIRWGRQSFLEVARDADEMDVVSHPAVQLFLDSIWYGCIKKPQHGLSHLWLTIRIYIGAFLPFLIPLIVHFEDYGENQASNSSSEEGIYQSENTLENNDDADTTVKGRLQCFYGTPIVKFHLTVLFHLIFLALYAYILLFNFFDTISVYEYALIAWVGTLMLEEMRQLWHSSVTSFVARSRLYVAKGGNQLDLLGFAFFISGLGCRAAGNAETFLEASHISYCFAFIIFTLRILSMFTVSEHLGPNLLMVRRMLKDLFFFIFILVVFLTGYGVASHSLLYPNESDFITFAEIFIKPYWNIFGELFLNEITYDPTTKEFSCTDDSDLIARGYRRCPTQNVVVPIMAAVYLLLANVLLLNLLIAMFSYTFDKLVDKTDKIWKFQRYSLIKEYYMRPALVAPFIFIPFFIWLLKLMFRSKCSMHDKPKCKKAKTNTAFEQYFNGKDSRDLMTWVQTNAENYLEDQIQTTEESKIFCKSIAMRLDNVAKTINSVKESMNTKHTVRAGVNSEEASLKTCNQSLQWIITALIDNQILPKHLPGITVHTKARCSVYPESKVERFPLQDHMVPWHIHLPFYHPPCHIHEPNRGHSSVRSGKRDDSMNFRGDKFDPARNLNQSSYNIALNSSDNVPRNPIGRTGLCGRGLLKNFGPNPVKCAVVTRWEKDEQGQTMLLEDKPVLQFLAVQRERTEWSIFENMTGIHENAAFTRSRSNFTDVRTFEEQSETLDQKTFTSHLEFRETEICREYCDDCRNTDNAWVETIVCNFHDDDGSLTELTSPSVGDGRSRTQWKRIDDSLNLLADHKKYLEKVADLHKAHFKSQ